MALRHFKGLLDNPETLAETTTDAAGNYKLAYYFTSACESSDNTTNWIEAAAVGYETVSTFRVPELSDPVIYCTNDPQVIDLSLRPFGILRAITSTSGAGQDPDGYLLVLDGTYGYPMGANDQEFLSEVSGQYSLELTELAGNCILEGENLRTVTVTARDTTASVFSVTCSP